MLGAGVLAGGSRWSGEGRAGRLCSPPLSAAAAGPQAGPVLELQLLTPRARCLQTACVLRDHQPSVVAAPAPASPLWIAAAFGLRACQWEPWRVVLSGAVGVPLHLDDPHPTGQGVGAPSSYRAHVFQARAQAQDGSDHWPVSPRVSGGRCEVRGLLVLVSAEGRSSGHWRVC